MSAVEMSAVSVELENCSIDLVKNGNKFKTLLHPVTASIGAGSMFAILGGSGSGKTSLLNVIAGRYDQNSFRVSGNVVFGGNYIGDIGFVTQQDFLLPFLTVRETVSFAAKLKTSTHFTQGDSCNADAINPNILAIHQIVDEAILDLGLKECSDTLIGDDSQVFGRRGISGGEKRRVSIACQIMTNPRVLCADEPTSGLDSFTAVTVVESLRRIASSSSSVSIPNTTASAFGNHRQTTVICSVHQPRADVFHLFDSILLLSKGGHPVYCGPVASMCSYFEALSFECPLNSNPADFYVDISSIDYRSVESELQSSKRVQLLAAAYKTNTARETSLAMHIHNGGSPVTDGVAANGGPCSRLPPYECPWLRQVWLLTGRFLLNNLRSGANVVGGILQAGLMGIVIMLIFYRLSDSLEDIESRNGLMYLSVSMECYILLIILVERYCTDLKVFDRELQDNMYSSSAYLIAHIVSSTPILILQPVLFSLPIYIGCNLRHGGVHFGVFVAVQVAMTFVTNGLAWASVSLNRSFTVASLIANTNFTFITIASGFLVVTSDIPIYLRWVKHISYIQYAYRILMSNEFSDREFSGCPSPNAADCSQYIGNDILASQSVEEDDYKSYPWLYIFVIWGVYYGVAFTCLHFLRFPVTGVVGNDGESEDEKWMEEDDNMSPNGIAVKGASQTPPVVSPKSDTDSDPESMLLNTYQECAPVSISVISVSLYVPMPTGSSWNRIRKGSFPPTQHNESCGTMSDDSRPHTPLVDSDTKPQDLQHAWSLQAKVKTDGSLKRILHDVSAEIKPGRLVALMGGSGSGKTTLLNLIAGRVANGCINNTPPTEKRKSQDEQYYGQGSVRFNGNVCSNQTLQSVVAYVQQFDFHYPMLTVSETFRFHASLKFGSSCGDDFKRKKTTRLIRLLGLSQCEGTRVGGEGMKGISGGECRRLSIGIQLLKDPSICVLDEPTTGLDTFTARHIVETLQEMAHVGHRTVLLSIHQPRYDIFGLIDDVILLSRGLQVWAGPADDMMKHFDRVGYAVPAFFNPADFILDMTSIDFRSVEKEEKSRAILNKLVSSWYVLTKSKTNVPESSFGGGVEAVPLACIEKVSESEVLYDLGLLLNRSYLNLSRQPVLASTRISQGLFFALILAAFYAPMGGDQNSIQNRIGLLYELTALCFIGMLSCIAIFPVERNVFYREYVDGGYSLLSFFAAYFIIAVPMILLTALLIALLVAYAIGAQPTLSALGIFTFVLFCFMLSGECIGVMFCAMFMHVGFSVNIMSIFIGITNQFTGFVSLSIPKWLNYFGYFSPAKWGSVILTNVVFRGETFGCSKSEELMNGECPLHTGKQVLDLYNMGYSNETYQSQFLCLLVLSIVTFLFFISSFVVFRIKAFKLSH